MKNIKTLLIILTAALFFTACKKKEEINNYDSISGVLTVGENVTADDFSTIRINMGKLNDEVSPLATSFETEDFDFIIATEVNDDGSFTFKNLDNGKYILVPSEGFSFDTFVAVTIDGKTLNQINITIERGTPENNCWFCACRWCMY